MGGTSWSHDHHVHTAHVRAATGAPAFAHDHDIRTGTVAAGCHEKMNPKGVRRESRDSAAHPNSVAIVSLLDVTGSMRKIPEIFRDNIGKLHEIIMRRGIIADPQILFAACGDYVAGDDAPLQVGQFESGNEMEDDLGRLYLEGGGGGNFGEDYILGLYWIADRTDIDCWNKRRHKGYVIMTGDEPFFPVLRRETIEAVIGDAPQADLTAEEVVARLKERYHVFLLRPRAAAHFGNSTVDKDWRTLLGEENVVVLDDAANVCETVAALIGGIEGTITDVAEALTGAGVDAAVARSVAKTVDPVLRSRALTAVATGAEGLPVAAAPSGAVRRL